MILSVYTCREIIHNRTTPIVFEREKWKEGTKEMMMIIISEVLLVEFIILCTYHSWRFSCFFFSLFSPLESSSKFLSLYFPGESFVLFA